MPTRGNRRVASALLLAALLSIAALPCGLFDVGLHTGFDPVDQVTNAKNYEKEQEAQRAEREYLLNRIETEMTEQRRQLSLTQTAVAAILTARAAPPAAAPPQALSSDDHTPMIMGVDFPETLPADGTRTSGTIRFTDAGHDVNLVSVQTVQGTFPSQSWDPGATAVYAGDSGTIPFEASCQVSETVRTVFTLQDATGHQSTQYVLAFRCQ